MCGVAHTSRGCLATASDGDGAGDEVGDEGDDERRRRWGEASVWASCGLHRLRGSYLRRGRKGRHGGHSEWECRVSVGYTDHERTDVSEKNSTQATAVQ